MIFYLRHISRLSFGIYFRVLFAFQLSEWIIFHMVQIFKLLIWFGSCFLIIYVEYYFCYDKKWSIIKSKFLIWTNIFFWIDFWVESSSFDWCYKLCLEIWISLFDYDMNLWYASQNTHANNAVLVFVHIVSKTLVGRGSHQPVWTDHSTVWSLMLITFWFSDEFYLMIFLLWSIWEIFL